MKQHFEVSLSPSKPEHIYITHKFDKSSRNKVLIDTSDNMILELVHTDNKLRAYDILNKFSKHQNPVFKRISEMFVKLRAHRWIPTLNQINVIDVASNKHSIHVPAMTEGWQSKCNNNIRHMFGEMFVEVNYATNPTLAWIYVCANIDANLMKEINHMFKHKEFRSPNNQFSLHATQFSS